MALCLRLNMPVDEMSSHTYHPQFVELPLPLGKFVEPHEFKQGSVHGLLNLAETLDVNRTFEVLSVPSGNRRTSYEYLLRFLKDSPE